MAVTEQTMTAQSGLRPLSRHLMSKNFSAPMSAPNPASANMQGTTASNGVAESRIRTGNTRAVRQKHSRTGDNKALLANKLEADTIRNDRRVAMGDVGKGTRMNKHWRALKRLHQRRVDRILHQHSESASNAKVVGTDGLAAAAEANNHALQAITQVTEVARERQNRHDLACNCNVEAGVAFVTLLSTANANGDASQVAVANVRDAAPANALAVKIQANKLGDLLRGQRVGVRLVDAEAREAALERLGQRALSMALGHQALEELLIRRRLFMVEPGLESGSAEVVGGRDGVNVACQMEVELVHRDDLRVAATSSATLDAKCGALRRLAQACNARRLEMRSKCLSEADCGGGLSLAKRRRRDATDNDILSIGLARAGSNRAEADLCLVGAVVVVLGLAEADFLRNLRDGLGRLSRCDFNVTGQRRARLNRQWLEVGP
eukprot:m.69679 g.69679  ORF g.69679 m.69679 type:complete len:436 (+) comp7835_c0_seq1:906-2213(+)